MPHVIGWENECQHRIPWRNELEVIQRYSCTNVPELQYNYSYLKNKMLLIQNTKHEENEKNFSYVLNNNMMFFDSTYCFLLCY
jgi:hypothetical protein